MVRLILSLLGGFQASFDDQPLNGFESNKVRALLAYLAVEAGGPHARQSLAALLWPDFSETTALANLRVALANLRGQLRDRDTVPPFLLIDRETIQFNTQADVWVDVWVFEDQGLGDKRQGIKNRGKGNKELGSAIGDLQSTITNQQSAIPNLQSAISLYRGPFLAGFSIPDSAPFEEWLILTRERLSRQALRSLYTLTEFNESCGEYEQALAYAYQQVALEPWLEVAHRQIMRLLALAGRPSEALAHYEVCKRVLADELGIEPAAETARLYEIIRTGQFERLRRGDLLPLPGESPYKGLQFFDEPDAALFFGREKLTDQLFQHVRQMLADAVGATHPGPDRTLSDDYTYPDQEWIGNHGSPLLTVVGASGSGKSSLVRAGLAPALKRDGYTVMIITPTAHPLEVLREKGIGDRKILVVDQFEELFTLCRSEEERQEFLDFLLTPTPSGDLYRHPLQEKTAVGDGGTLPSPNVVSNWGGVGGGVALAGVVLALRADFYGHCAQYPRLRQALCSRQEYIGPMSVTELRQAIEQPALRNSWSFEPGLVDLILRDAGASEIHPPEPGALPLLEHALLETWQRRSGRTLTLKGYAEAGGVHGAIARTAEGVFASLSTEQQELARRIFLRLTELGEGAQDTRRLAPLSELTHMNGNPSQMSALLHILAEARLITLAEGTVEVAHEALIREWPALRNWLSEDREGLRLHRHLTDSAEAWAELERDAGELYRGARLAQVLEWEETHHDDLNELEREYLQASQWQADSQRRNAEQQSALAFARELASNAILILEQDSRLSLLLALEAVSVSQQAGINPVPWELQQALHDVTIKSRLIYNISDLGGLCSWNVIFSPDGKWIAVDIDTLLPEEIGKTFTGSGITSIRDALTGEEVRSFGGYPSAISPDGKWIAVDESFSKGICSVKNFYTGEQVITITGFITQPQDAYNSFSFSPDGNWLAWSGNGRGESPRLWDLTAWRQVGAQAGVTLALTDATLILEGCNSIYNPVAFSPDGKRLATNCGPEHNTLKVWDSTTGQGLWESDDQPAIVFSIAFSPDGNRIVSCDYTGNIFVWDAATGERLLSLKGFSDYVQKVTYSPDGNWIAAAGQEGVILWNARNGKRLMQMSTNALGLDFSPDGKRLAVTRGRTLEMWDVTITAGGELAMAPVPEGGEYFIVSDDHKQWVVGRRDGMVQIFSSDTFVTINEWRVYTPTEEEPEIDFVPMLNTDNTRLATARDQMQNGITTGTITIWDVASRRKLLDLQAQGGVHFSAFNPDSTLLASGENGDVNIWDLTNGQKLQSISVPLKLIWWLKFSPDGTRLAVNGITDNISRFDNRILIWNLAREEDHLDDPIEIKAFDRNLGFFFFSPDGNSLVASGLNGVKVFDVYTGALKLHIPGYDFGSQMSMYSSDGKYILACWHDGTTRLYDAQTGTELIVYKSPGNFTDLWAAFTPDGKEIVSLGSEGYFHKFIFQEFTDLVNLARSRVTRTLTKEECRKYLHRDACP